MYARHRKNPSNYTAVTVIRYVRLSESITGFRGL
uniref:Uncharacterized protein n=1 Tax=Moniliophthora roreri TaxID=221103 RepID=A0A0W0FC58_MONRR